ncbi:hypothetical protein VB264_17225 [Arcicella aquatica]|uniref:VWFA domain-containing protein n=1 Tax=Arcicella aquatica TaxID=217141 RepID=A0ABU5QR51_9BACT|nr:hypothetical protein [Arcicella aquatica]MEA5259543.1 hypothetical protein [Arcicella aquatica]
MTTITTISRTLVLMIIIHFFLTIQVTLAQSTGKNYVVLLDLSDRLLSAQQPERDKAIIQAIFKAFEEQVRKNYYIYSHDSFKVAIIPQEGGIDEQRYTQELFIDMAKLGIKDKRVQLDKLKAQMPELLNKLYAEATKNKVQSKQFQGTDIWRYFNDYLSVDLQKNAQNKLFILTDGYFDFESNRYIGKQGNRSTDSRMIARLRNLPNWKEVLSLPNEGLISIAKNFTHLEVSIIEITPKNKVLQELDIIYALWKKWLTEMKVQKVNFLNKGNIAQITQRIGEL